MDYEYVASGEITIEGGYLSQVGIIFEAVPTAITMSGEVGTASFSVLPGDIQAFLNRNTRFNYIHDLPYKNSDPYLNSRFIFFYTDSADSYSGKAVVGYMPYLQYNSDTEIIWGSPFSFSGTDTKNISCVNTIYRNFVVYYSRSGRSYYRIGYVDGLSLQFDPEKAVLIDEEIVSSTMLDGIHSIVATARITERGYIVAAHLNRTSADSLSEYEPKNIYSNKYRWTEKSRKDIQLKVFSNDENHFTVVHVPPFRSKSKLVATKCEVINKRTFNVLESREIDYVYNVAESDHDLTIDSEKSIEENKSIYVHKGKREENRISISGPQNYLSKLIYDDRRNKTTTISRKNDYNFPMLFSNSSLRRRDLLLHGESFSDTIEVNPSEISSIYGKNLSNDFGLSQYFVQVFSDENGCYFAVQSYELEYTGVPSYVYVSGSADFILWELHYIYGPDGEILVSGSADYEIGELHYIYEAGGTITISGAAIVIVGEEDTGLYGDVLYGDSYYRDS